MATQPLRIGVMLRALDEKGGVGVYTRNILDELLALDTEHEWVLFFRTPERMGEREGNPRVHEHLVGGRQKPVWDQIAIPRAAGREGVDVLFHPKFTVPLRAPCPTVMTVHGADWFIPEHARFYKPLDVAYIRAVMPHYFRQATAVCSVSKITTDNFNRILGLEPGKVVTTYLAPARHFGRVEDPERLRAVRERYDLPERFILTLSKVGGDTRKNAAGIFEAFRRVAEAAPHALVVGGRGLETFRGLHGIPDEGWGARVHFPGWIDQADLPAVYSLADLYLYPSNLEAFPIPVSEAMKCGTPIVTSRENGLEEIAGEGALLVDPRDPDEIAGAVLEILGDEALRERLGRAGLTRSERYSWDRCARRTLAVLEWAARGGAPSAEEAAARVVPEAD